MRIRGTVKWFNVRRGYGFLCDEEGMEYFVHYSQIRMDGFKKLEEGQAVTFEAGEDRIGRTIALEVETEGEDGEAQSPGEEEP